MKSFTSGIAIAAALAASLTVAIAVQAQPPAPPRQAPSQPQRRPQPPPQAQPPQSAASPEAEAAYADMQQTLGLVPTFMQAFSEVGIAAAWDEFKSLELNPRTALSGKTKELIGLAVASQIPCKYCVYFHTQAARMNGATQEDAKEAIAMSAITRHWSTVLNGMQIDEVAFQKDMAKVLAHARSGKKPPGAEQPITDAASAYKDIERTMGSVPTFVRSFPAEAIAPAWREMKSVQLNPDTVLDPKTKELIGLGVAAQVPCKYCIYLHTESAKLHGATDLEIKEAVAMAALTRHWSTVLNGSQIDETQFRREVDQMMPESKRSTTMKESRPPRR